MFTEAEQCGPGSDAARAVQLLASRRVACRIVAASSLLPGLESAAIQQIVSGLGLQAIWHPQRLVPSLGPLEIETRTVEPSPSVAWILKDVETTLRPLLRQLANAQVGLVMGGGGGLF